MPTFHIEMTSDVYGSEVFEYDSKKDRIKGLARLMEKAEKISDGVPREYWFGAELFDGDLTGCDELVAKWNGRSWDVVEYADPNDWGEGVIAPAPIRP